MRINQLLPVSAMVALAGCVLPPPQPALAPPGSRPTITATNGGSLITINNTLAAANGQTIRLGFLHNAQNPDCSLSDALHPVLNIISQPSHGTLNEQQIDDFPTYHAGNPLVKCSQARIPGTAISYTPQAGFSGTDQLSYRVFTSDGHEFIFNSTINVAP